MTTVQRAGERRNALLEDGEQEPVTGIDEFDKHERCCTGRFGIQLGTHECFDFTVGLYGMAMWLGSVLAAIFVCLSIISVYP